MKPLRNAKFFRYFRKSELEIVQNGPLGIESRVMNVKTDDLFCDGGNTFDFHSSWNKLVDYPLKFGGNGIIMKKLSSVLFLVMALGFFAFTLASLRPLITQSDKPFSLIPDVPIAEVGKFSPMQVVPPFEPITDVPVISANRVTHEVMDSELVLGLTLHGESRAYPINMLTGPSREIVNDVLGDVPIAATW